MGDHAHPWQETSEVLLRFGESCCEAVSRYEVFVKEGIALGRRPELTGGGLVRSAGGWGEIVAARRGGIFLKSDERILGSSEFVERVLRAAEEHVQKKARYAAESYDLEHVAQRVADVLKIEVAEVWQHSKRPPIVEARSLLCHWATHELGLTTTDVAARLGVSQSAVSRLAVRGEYLADKTGWLLK